FMVALGGASGASTLWAVVMTRLTTFVLLICAAMVLRPERRPHRASGRRVASEASTLWAVVVARFTTVVLLTGALVLLRAGRASGTARRARAPRGGSPAIRLRRRHPAPAVALGGAGRHGQRVRHPFPCRSLAGAAGHAEVAGPARARPAAGRLWSARHRRADGGDAHHLRAAAVRAQRGGARSGAGRGARRLPSRRGARAARRPRGIWLRARRG